MFVSQDQSRELHNRLKTLGFNVNDFYPPNTAAIHGAPHANLVNLFSNGKLEDNTPEFREDLLHKLKRWYENYILLRIKDSYVEKIKNAIESWTYLYNIARLNNMLHSDEIYGVNKIMTIPVTNDNGYGIQAEIEGAALAVKEFEKAKYAIYIIDENTNDALVRYSIAIRFIA